MNTIATVGFTIVIAIGITTMSLRLWRIRLHRPPMPESVYHETVDAVGADPAHFVYDMHCPTWPPTRIPAMDRRTRAALDRLSNEH